MKYLNNLIDELEQHILFLDKTNTTVSKASVGWHIEHSLKVLTQIIDAVEKSDPEKYKWCFNLKSTLVLSFNKIPRGKGKAPKTVIPEVNITGDTLKHHVEKTRFMINKIENLHPNHYFKHPYFGDMNLKPTKKFLGIHTNHHLKIIKDIIK
jgi:hypothetical protein